MIEPYGHSVPAQRKSAGVGSVLRSIVQIVIATVLLAVLLKVFVLDAIHIPSPSMQSTLLVGDYVFVNKLVYGARISDLPLIKDGTFFFHFPKIRDVRRGDVVVFRLPDVGEGGSASQPMYFVKRCIAVS
ncbi:MAG TPA: signal peptidase I, partial [Bacteroidota bacterium]|nr:signal peptidase I [Bacteroidota bacterium]